jgi:hypothetical protein
VASLSISNDKVGKMEQRRFLAINFRVGTRENGYLVGPALVSTSDYAHFHLWDEPSAALLDVDDYEIIKLYPRGLTYDAVAQQFAQNFPSAMIRPDSSAGGMAAGAASWWQAWTGRGQQQVPAA